ncbi:hypothetical protein B0H67DRAFT_543401, partial [Lasiosphaeris hirsuta]
MYSAGPLWFLLAALVVSVSAQNEIQQGCSCSGLDYTNGGSYLIDGNSDSNFTFTSVFNGACFDATIVPILISPEGYGYQCSVIQSGLDGVEQPSVCDIVYANMNDGSWAVVVQAPEHDFVVQREFNLTAGGAANTVVITITPTLTVGVTSTIPGTTETNWIVETETEYAEPEIVTGDCYLQTDTVFSYIPGPVTHYVSTIARWSTVGAVTQYYQTT